MNNIENAENVTYMFEQVNMMAAIANDLQNMLQSGCTLKTVQDEAHDYLLSEIGGNIQMAHKYQQRVEVTDNGRKVVKWATGETQEEFQKSLYEILRMYRKYEADSALTNSNTVWDEYAWEWFRLYKEPHIKLKTATTRKCFMKNYVIPAFEGKYIDSISRNDVAEFLNQHRELSKAYMRDIMNYMNGIFKAALDDGIIRKNPMDSALIKNPCKREAHRNALTEDEKWDIIAHIPELKKEMDRAFMAFLMYTPMRPGEIFALQWEDIDFECNVIHIMRGSSFDNGRIIIGEDGETKTGWSGVRMIPLHGGLKTYLLPIQKASGVVPSRDAKGHEGEPFTEQTAKCQWGRIKKQIDVHGMTPYVGRHTYLTEVLHNGTTIDTAMKMAGHKDERMLTRHYLHANDKHVKAAGDVMEGYFARLGTA